MGTYSILAKGCHAKEEKIKPSVIKFSYFVVGFVVVAVFIPLREAGNLCLYVKFPN